MGGEGDETGAWVTEAPAANAARLVLIAGLVHVAVSQHGGQVLLPGVVKTYRDVAAALGLSEPSVKRLFADENFSEWEPAEFTKLRR
jgi:hypothetical protein